MKKIAIGLGTSKRPKMLSLTLDSLIRLESPEKYKVEILLVDNAPEDPVKDIYEQFQKKVPYPIHYFLEAEKGIVPMRNRVVEEAIASGFDYLAFIDDDEIVSTEWLLEMITTLERYHADVVSGRTLRRLPDHTPDYIKTGGFFQKGSRPTGIRRPTSSTCNVLFDLKKLCMDWGMRFDIRLNFVGSSDILFFNQAHQRGARIIWSNEAVVEEIIPDSRATREWLLQRSFRKGNTMAVRYKIQNPTLLAYLKGIYFATGELIIYCGYQFTLLRAASPEIASVKMREHLNIAKGIINGLFGRQIFEEYRQQHGY